MSFRLSRGQGKWQDTLCGRRNGLPSVDLSRQTVPISADGADLWIVRWDELPMFGVCQNISLTAPALHRVINNRSNLKTPTAAYFLMNERDNDVNLPHSSPAISLRQLLLFWFVSISTSD